MACVYRLGNHEELVTGVSHLFGALTLTLRGYTLQLWLFGVYTFIDTSIFYGVLFCGTSGISRALLRYVRHQSFYDVLFCGRSGICISTTCTILRY